VKDVQVDNDSLPKEWDDHTLKGDFPNDAEDSLGEPREGISRDEIVTRITFEIGLSIGEPVDDPDEKTNYSMPITCFG